MRALSISCATLLLLGCGPAGDDDPLANVYRINPVENASTEQVALRHLTADDGSLQGRYANVWNCVARPGGQKITVDLGAMAISGTLCQFERTAAPGPDGDYLHITPPAVDIEDKDFAEVMMYHHITTLHDHYNSYGVTHIDKSLRAIVNLQGRVDLLGSWIGLPNANYVPVEHTQLLTDLVGIDMLEGEEAVIFGYNNISPQIDEVNFSFDAMTIYHEYTHFTIGGQRLLEPAVDRYGPDASPIALNEAFADYFPSSFLDTPVAGGTYSLGKLARNLDNEKRCPDDMTGETHIDGEVASGAFWQLRRLLGTRTADQVLWNAALSFTLRTSFDEAARAILDEVQRQAPQHHAAANKIFTDRGMLGCNRLRTHADFDNNGPMAAYSPMVEGRHTAPGPFVGADAVPAYVQYRVALDPGTRQVTIEYTPMVGDASQGMATRGDVALALRSGGDPITYDYDSGKPVSSAHLVARGQEQGETAYRLELSGPCIVGGGELVFQLVNRGDEPATITSVKVSQSETVTSGSTTFNHCD